MPLQPVRNLRSTALTASALAVAGIGLAFALHDPGPSLRARAGLGTHLGGTPVVAVAPPPAAPSTQVADDVAIARRYLETAISIDPDNRAALDALSRLMGPVIEPGANALNAALAPRRAANVRALQAASNDFDGIAAPAQPFGSPATIMMAAGGEVVDALPANSPVTERVPVGAGSADSLARDVVVRDSVARIAARHATARRVAARRRAAALAARDSLTSSSDSAHTQTVAVSAKPKHKRTWPWTRAQRWLVAKGVVGGSGAGVVVGALIGNLPGAVLAGSLGGGAVGFKKATKIGPAEPYPTTQDSAEFTAKQAREDREKVADREKAGREKAGEQKTGEQKVGEQKVGERKAGEPKTAPRLVTRPGS